MIGAVLAVLRDEVVAPQTLDTIDPDRRVYLDRDLAPITAYPQSVEVFALTSSPISATIGLGGVVTYRHICAVDVEVQHGDRAIAYTLRDGIVGDLFDRALALDWPNLLDGFEACEVSAAYGEGATDDGKLAASATLTFTVDVERRP